MEKILDFKRDGCYCDKCGKNTTLYQFRLDNGEPSEDSYCIDCFEKIVNNLELTCQIDGNKTCNCEFWCKSKDEQFDSLGM